MITGESATLDPSFPLDNSMGAMMIGVIVSAVLHGITLMQAFMYWRNFRKDALYLKAMVLTTVIFDAIHLAFISHTVYHYVITNYHHPENLLLITWSVIMEALFTGVNGGLVQTFYVMRVWRLSHQNSFLAGGILFFILCTTGCGTAWVVLGMQMGTYERLLSITPLTITINALSTFVDISIAASLCILLNKSRTGFKKSDSIINRLIIFVVNTGVLTTCCAIASLICLIASSKSLIYASFYFCIGRLYTNSFLATLNARRSFQSNFDDSNHMMMSMPTSVVSPQGTQLGIVGKSSTKNISIRIETATTKDNKDKQDSSLADTRNGQSDDELSKKGQMF
ncbi:hypothetical protein BDN70DRAFT_936930 [Pholiota conissans]|uniref:DUF6534 domain-containing protein n=1 Tax=Pholiota conissans TaxID=109636 RepID=A0A9P5YS03_9AGAR|nr:hypothetical protein BDN70DRAFT_936930 [Pholiota conissans]